MFIETVMTLCGGRSRHAHAVFFCRVDYSMPIGKTFDKAIWLWLLSKEQELKVMLDQHDLKSHFDTASNDDMIHYLYPATDWMPYAIGCEK